MDGPPLSDEKIKKLIAEGVEKVWVRPTGRLQEGKKLEFEGGEVVTSSARISARASLMKTFSLREIPRVLHNPPFVPYHS